MILKRALLYSKGFTLSTVNSLYKSSLKLLRGVLMIDKRDTLKFADLKKAETVYRFPEVSSTKFKVEDCLEAIEACPTESLTKAKKAIYLNLFSCVRCGECMRACKDGVIKMTYTSEISFRKRDQANIIFCES